MQKTLSITKRILLLIVGSIFLLLMLYCLSGCISGDSIDDTSPDIRQDLVLEKSGYTIDSDGNCNWAIIINNPNLKNWCANNVEVTINGLDNLGNIIGTQSDYINFIAANGTMGDAGIANIAGAVSYEIEISADQWEEVELDQTQLAQVDYVDQLTQTIDESKNTIFSGNVINDTDQNWSNSEVIIILENGGGDIITGYSAQISQLPAKSSISFSTSSYDIPDYSKIITYVNLGTSASTN